MSASDRRWYNPTVWPSSLRWLAAIPLPGLAAVVVYFLYSVVNGIMPMMPSAVTSLLAVGVGAYSYVLTGRLLAPRFNVLTGATLATMALVGVGYYVGLTVQNGTRGNPTWYAVLVGLVCAGGAVAAAVAELPIETVRGPEFFDWMPIALRWLLFVPLAVTLCFAAAVVAAIPFFFLHIDGSVAQLLNTPLATVVFISVAVAVIPRWKRQTGFVLCAIVGLFAIIEFVAAVDRPLMARLMSGYYSAPASELQFLMSPWYQMLSAFGVFVGALIGANGAVEATMQPGGTT